MIWFMMIVTGIFTFGTRFIMLNNVASKKLPAWLVEALNFVPIAVLTAIIVPAVLIDPTSQSFSIIDNPRLLAALIAIAVALDYPPGDYNHWSGPSNSMGAKMVGLGYPYFN